MCVCVCVYISEFLVLVKSETQYNMICTSNNKKAKMYQCHTLLLLLMQNISEAVLQDEANKNLIFVLTGPWKVGSGG